VAVYERGGLPIDEGRARRLITPRLRLAMWARDQGCTYPGCGAPARCTEGHHIRHVPLGGRTDLVKPGAPVLRPLQPAESELHQLTQRDQFEFGRPGSLW
jgi:hypothetical protein